MKEIPLTQGKVAIVDDEDFEWLNQWEWWYSSKGYAARHSVKIHGKQKTILMHREINHTPQGMDTDHINGDGLDNRKVNLRDCTVSENSHNQKLHKNNTSGFKGVSPRYGKWRAYIKVGVKVMHLGSFFSPELAALAYDMAAREYYGEFAKTNFQEGQ